MVTVSKRIDLNVDNTLYSELKALSNRKKQNISDVSVSLIQQALKLEEDIYFSQLSDKRLSQKQNRIPHNKVY